MIDLGAVNAYRAGIQGLVSNDYKTMPDGDDAIVECHGLTRSFAGECILEGADFNLNRGEFVFLFGGSGKGKSVFLRTVFGIGNPVIFGSDNCVDGEVYVFGKALHGISKSDRRKRYTEIYSRLGYCPQKGGLFGSMSVAENIAFPLREHFYDVFYKSDVCASVREYLSTRSIEYRCGEELKALNENFGIRAQQSRSSIILGEVNLLENIIIQARVDYCMELVGLDPWKDRDKDVAQLSGGMLKRVAVARVLADFPELIILDEPTTGLDPPLSLEVFDLISKLKKMGYTVLATTHDNRLGYFDPDRIDWIHERKIRRLGAKQDVIASDDEAVRRFFFPDEFRE
ncbi:MAG: ATP-binding cassette domain-containing protein [Nanoarchaeota archaeon]|nr:ATP-binding cassette domain-containing protein [Nanoarchaeota archaeon]MBU1004431.1 ATP-binding cassette domain-containing protein [Nanoarchaeota archaeon]MBU1946682.1 ATP-binding cassette domain-containing protein [Nanoarchaeota archaeon]